MAPEDDRRYPHFIIDGFSSTEPFKSPGSRGRPAQPPPRDRPDHGAALLAQVQGLEATAVQARQVQTEAGLEEGLGLQLEFESFPDVELAFESLARERQGIELLNVRHERDRTYATVFVPDGRLDHFEGLVRDYLAEKHDRAGRPRDNKRLLEAIEQIRAASLEALWTDTQEVFPDSDDESLWWEVWLPVRGERRRTVAAFRGGAEVAGMKVAPGELEFPERTVLLAHASAGQLKQSVLTLNSVAELRRAKETADFFDALPPEEQPAWVEELVARMEYAEDGGVPHVCLLDTGVNRGHPLLEPALSGADLHTVEPAWGVDDEHGHGTQMAGLALAGNLTELLDTDDAIVIDHRLESVKLLRQDGDNAGDAQHHGHLTVEAVACPEISAPARPRTFAMAVTARDNRDRGRPSAWSAAIDGLAADADADGASPRLLVVSAGNIHDPNAWAEHPHSNDTDSVHDPAQAWNALTVGAFTDLTDIAEPGDFVPIARSGALSPFSTTSLTWERHWPLKPDVVLEGGNAAKDAVSAVWTPSLSLLTAHHRPNERLLTTARATSAATALASRMAAQIMAAYPALWPEAVRGLIVHSAEWRDEMGAMYLPSDRSPTKDQIAQLVRRVGFGVPDVHRALESAASDVTMVAQESINPFQKEQGRPPKLRDMRLHSLPWPQHLLEGLGDALVEMRVTLSYFIEPNPSHRGHRSRYRYESHGLRFEVRRPAESIDDFRARINRAARDDEEGTRTTEGDPGWQLGKQNRHKGSLHRDTWRGTAAELASRGNLAVYPALGWWKTRPRLERFDKSARYALIVSIKAPNVDIDLYSEIAEMIRVSVAVET